MTTILFACMVALSALPSERHIDCLTWAGQGTVEVDVSVVAVDGTSLSFTIEALPGSSPTTVRNLLLLTLQRADWKAVAVGEGALLIKGSKKSQVRAVEFKSAGWKPTVSYVSLLPKK